MTKTAARFTKTEYRAGCETCVGLAVQWEGPTAHLIAQRHASTTGHKGVWYERDTRAVYDITEPLSLEELEALESQPIDPIVYAIGEDITHPLQIAQRIKAKRKAAGLTQAEMAEAMGISRPLFVALEHGQRLLRASEIEHIAQKLNMSREELLDLPTKGNEE